MRLLQSARRLCGPADVDLSVGFDCHPATSGVVDSDGLRWA
jgi:hypothetical protein